ncbi:MAG TPA: aryl-sulfate sulfotransferase, partial [Ferruginibacter sp.]|nr:aryl-sulfate sulfotransferase [Ferruginibacter sp.]
LLQDFDPSLAGYGEPAKNPHLLNVNYRAKKDEDWLHFNSIAYNAELDQVLISNRNLCEIYIIDHSTSIAEAASHTGGRYKKGGDLLYRWGNQEAYGCGSAAMQKLYWQHSAHWISAGLKDAGKIMVFNNGTMRSVDLPYSSLEIISPPVDAKGNYEMMPGQACLPTRSFWNSREIMTENFYSHNVSNGQRLSNGNTLICVGAGGTIFEIDASGKIVWKYISPIGNKGIIRQGAQATDNPIFRGLFYDKTYSAFKHKKLKPGKPIEQQE